jgi:competence protein ComEA
MHNVHRGRENREQRRISRSGLSEEEQTDAAILTGADAQSLDLNHATAAQLASVDGLDLALAQVIVERRVHHGHYVSWDELAELPGMTDEALQALQRTARLGGQADANGTLTHH